ncbi:hypothetical protein HanRHA438_Chr16g0772071 [Helianthus annuus]|nr:hypothetical protein HanRHA438_Chr16g0772071 [Helianthus annuus]
MMRLGVVDFLAFSGVCKLYGQVPHQIGKKFMLSRQPMAIRISTRVAKRKECWLEDCDGRMFRTILPCSSGRISFPVHHVVADLNAFQGTLVFSQTADSGCL